MIAFDRGANRVPRDLVRLPRDLQPAVDLVIGMLNQLVIVIARHEFNVKKKRRRRGQGGDRIRRLCCGRSCRTHACTQTC